MLDDSNRLSLIVQSRAERSDKREELQGPKKMVNLISEPLDA